MNLVVFGANGKTGRLVTALALTGEHQVTAVTRRPREFPIAGRGLTVAAADVRDAAAVAPIVEGADAVVSVLGRSADRSLPRPAHPSSTETSRRWRLKRCSPTSWSAKRSR